MKRTRISEWPKVEVKVRPETMERLEALADDQGTDVSKLVRAALDRAYGPEPLPERAPEPFPHGANLRPPPGRGFLS
jgi:hypothetical protein